MVLRRRCSCKLQLADNARCVERECSVERDKICEGGGVWAVVYAVDCSGSAFLEEAELGSKGVRRLSW